MVPPSDASPIRVKLLALSVDIILPRVPLSQGKAMLVFHRGTQHEGWPGWTGWGDESARDTILASFKKWLLS